MGESSVIKNIKLLLFYAGITNLGLGVLFSIILLIIRFIEMGKYIKLLQKRLDLNQQNLEALYAMSKIGRGMGKT